ncbi:hypothetical protein TNCV_4730231 [Trichonephila clavipes]|nr:hypothetical protein TNCV_4730231 [Trichonephila clavipes]
MVEKSECVKLADYTEKEAATWRKHLSQLLGNKDFKELIEGINPVKWEGHLKLYYFLNEKYPKKNRRNTINTMGSLVVRPSDSRPEGLCSMPDATKYPPSTNGSHAKIVEGEIGGVANYRPFGEFRQANSPCHLYCAQGQGQRQAYF